MSPNVRVLTQTGIQFTEQNPLLVIVGKDNKNEWNIQVSSKDKVPGSGKFYSDIMHERIDAIPDFKAKLKENFGLRGIKGGPVEPHFMRDPDHHPIVAGQGEYVRFQCEYPFIVWAHRDTDVTPNFDSPENPFGWTISQKSTEQVPYVVNAVTAAGLTAQRFYKTVAWIKVNGQTILVDPDMIGI